MQTIKVIFTVGISASGKTTWAEKFVKENRNYVNVNRDDIRARLFCGGTLDWNKYKFSKSNESAVTAEQRLMIREAIEAKQNIIISDTNLNPKSVNSMLEFLQQFSSVDIDIDIEYKWFDIDILEALRRDRLRKNSVGAEVMYKQYESYCKLREHRMDDELIRKYYSDMKLPKAIIVDVDGTVADMTGIRKPFDWDKVSLDKPIEEIIFFVRQLVYHRGYHVLFFSGRDGVCYDDTYKWLSEHVVLPDGTWELHTRPEGNTEKDWVIKDRLFEEFALGKYDVKFAIDDRPQMIRHWWFKRGIKCLACANPYLEF